MKRKSYFDEGERYEYEEEQSRREEEDSIAFEGRGRSKHKQNLDDGFLIREVDVSQIPSHILTNLTQVHPQEGGVLSPDEVDPDTDAWIIQCPKNVLAIELRELLRGKKIHLNGNPTILNTVEDEEESLVLNQKFESTAHSRKDSDESLSLLLPDFEGSYKMVSVPLKGYITIREHLEELTAPDIKIRRKKMHKLPSGIKERHPIYGVDFNHASCLTKVTRTRSPRKEVIQQTQKKGADRLSSKYLSKTSMLNRLNYREESPAKSRRKQYEEIVKKEINSTYEEITVPSKTKKSKKRKRDEVDDEELPVEEELEPVKVKKSKRIKSEQLEDDVFYSPDTSPTKSKKNKKSKAF